MAHHHLRFRMVPRWRRPGAENAQPHPPRQRRVGVFQRRRRSAARRLLTEARRDADFALGYIKRHATTPETQAAAMGVLQAHLSGGEPAARRDLPEIVSAARAAELYANLITSGVGLSVTPTGKVLPCHAAESITSLTFETIRDRPLADIWRDGAAFTAYRGTHWMPDPCKSCDRRTKDWGGCRCQAFAWSGDAATVDPVCSKAPNHAEIRAAALAEDDAHGDDFEYRAL